VPPLYKNSVWNLDTGAAFLGVLTIMDCNSKVFWQSDKLRELYPNEIGRN
jgi:serine/threonine protein phosphatase 1